MWSAVKSPLLMGNDIDSLSARDLSILINPAVIAVSQDPAGSSAVRVWRYYVNETDQYGQGEISMWSGSLFDGDQLVVLLNARNSSRMMNTTAAEIFTDAGGAISTEAQESWTIHDLWADRMPVDVAQSIIDGNATANSNVSSYYYNATATSYADGLSANSTLLLGKAVGTLAAGGTIETEVPRHGVAMMRLRLNLSTKRKRDEL
ncbi:putative alpha-galactosidase [Phaeomoniella chlamydospora]|uniref:alpha-galactosidase n=1 Tax=Phaeomoniella chlamydospora TaxID=158046 RepID=A0A0G2ESB7_PHACM|nr:putative alpha-galactosidase [Phaeomoniella chlamydospora]